MNIDTFNIRMDKAVSDVYRANIKNPFDFDGFALAFDEFSQIIGEHFSSDTIEWDVLEDAFSDLSKLDKWQYLGGSYDAPYDFVIIRLKLAPINSTTFDVFYEVFKGRPLNCFKTALGSRCEDD